MHQLQQHLAWSSKWVCFMHSPPCSSSLPLTKTRVGLTHHTVTGKMVPAAAGWRQEG